MKKTLCLALCLALLAVVNPVFFSEEAAACEGAYPGGWYLENGYEEYRHGDYSFAVKGDEAVLLNYFDYSDKDEIVLDAKIGPYQLVEIADLAMESCSAKRIVIPEGVVEIGTAVFEHSSAEEIVLPSSLRILHGAFTNMSEIQKIVIPEGVVEMHDTVFYNCEKLKEVTLPSTLKSIDNLFGYCPLVETVILPEGLESIDGMVFDTCASAKSLVIPSTVRSMSTAPVFRCDSFETLTVAEGNQSIKLQNNCLYTADGILLQGFQGCVIPDGGLTSIGIYAFRDADWLTEIDIPAGVTSIGAAAFRGCKNLKKVDFPDSLVSVGDSAFAYCESLGEASLPDGVEIVENAAFSECGLLDVHMPTGLKSVGEDAFRNTATRTVIFPETLEFIGERALMGCTQLETLRFPAGMTSLPANLILGSENIKELVLPAALETYEPGALSFMSNLQNVVLDENNPNFRMNGFFLTDRNGTLLAALSKGEIPKGTKVIGESAFLRYAQDEPLYIPEGVERVEDYAFSQTDLPEIILPSSLKTIGDSAFSSSTIESMYIPATVERIGMYLLSGCAYLHQVDMGHEKDPGDWSEHYLDCDGRVVWGVDARRTDIYRISGDFRYEVVDGNAHIVGYLGDAEELVIPEKIDGYTVVALGMNAFEDQTVLRSVTLPNTIRTIERHAFHDCDALKELILSKCVRTIKQCAIRDCDSLEYVYIPHAVTVEMQALLYVPSLQKVECAPDAQPASWSKHWIPSSYVGEIVWGVPHPDAETSVEPPTETSNEVSEEISEETSEEVSGEVSEESSREENVESGAEDSEESPSADSSDVSLTESKESSDTAPTESNAQTADERSYLWCWILLGVLLLGSGAAVFFVRKKK